MNVLLIDTVTKKTNFELFFFILHFELKKTWIRIRVHLKSWIRIRIQLIRIHSSASVYVNYYKLCCVVNLKDLI